MISKLKDADVDRKFWSRVLVGDGACWEWAGPVGSTGYGKISQNQQTLSAHRVSYELNIGPIPIGMLVCHHCDNRKCVRPSHLFVGTFQENMDDMKAKGRQKNPHPCDKHPHAKLTVREVQDIRRRISDGERTKDITELYGVEYTAIHNIRHKNTWRWLPDEGLA